MYKDKSLTAARDRLRPGAAAIMIQIHLSDLKAARVRASRREAGPARPGVTVLVGNDWPWTGLSDLKRGHKKGTARANSCSSEVSEPVVNLERTVDDSEYGGRPGPGSTRLPNRS